MCEWISINERKPKYGQQVLVYRKSKKMCAPHVSMCTYYGDRGANEFSRRTQYVTHWIPLPKPPKEELNDRK